MKILIIGLGSIAKKHINALKEINQNIEIYVLRSSKKSPLYKDTISIYNLAEVENSEWSFAIISSPTANHKVDIENLIRLGIPLFIEKPIYHKLELEDIINRVVKTGLKTYVACNLRFLDSLVFTKKYLIDNKDLKINEVNVYCGSYLPQWRTNGDFKNSYSAFSERGGGVHLDLIHEIDYTYWLFGQPLEVSNYLTSKSSLNLNSIDYANYILCYSGFTANVTLNYYRKEPKRTLEILFETHTVTVNLLTNEVYEGDELIYRSNQTVLDTYKSQLDFFIKNDKINFNDIQEAYEVLKICLNNSQ